MQLGLLDKTKAWEIWFLTIFSSYNENYFNQSKNSSESSPSTLSSDWCKREAEDRIFRCTIVGGFNGKKIDVLSLKNTLAYSSCPTWLRWRRAPRCCCWRPDTWGWNGGRNVWGLWGSARFRSWKRLDCYRWNQVVHDLATRSLWKRGKDLYQV